MKRFIITEHDGDNDIVETYGIFPSIEAAMQWLRTTRMPEWIAEYEKESSPFRNDVGKLDVGFYSNGAFERRTAYRWQVRNVMVVR